MSQENRRFMRLLVFFDLPTVNPKDKRAYTLFRRFLLRNGYDMIQWSVYSRIVNGFDNMQTQLKHLSANLPPEGSVRCLQVSEKQFTKMMLLVGEPKKQEKVISSRQLVLL